MMIKLLPRLNYLIVWPLCRVLCIHPWIRNFGAFFQPFSFSEGGKPRCSRGVCGLLAKTGREMAVKRQRCSCQIRRFVGKVLVRERYNSSARRVPLVFRINAEVWKFEGLTASGTDWMACAVVSQGWLLLNLVMCQEYPALTEAAGNHSVYTEGKPAIGQCGECNHVIQLVFLISDKLHLLLGHDMINQR